MKYTLAAVALAIASPAVFAQSSVTLYGLIDVSGQYIKSGNSAVREISNGGLAGSRFGFKGTEDLGAGNFVDFVIEGGINVDTGSSAQGGALFGRQAFGAIRNAAWGTLSAGRQYSSLYIQTNEFSAFGNVPGTSASTAAIGGYAGGYEPVQGGGTSAAAAAVVAGGVTTTPAVNPTNSESLNGGPARVNNSLRYTTPSFEGFKASVLYGAGEVSGNANGSRLIDGSIRYTGFGFDAQVSYVSDKAAGSNAIINTAYGSTVALNVTTITASASYTLDALRVYAGYLNGDDKRDVVDTFKHDGEAYWLGADYRVGQSLFKAQWVSNKVDNHAATSIASGDWKTDVYGLGYQFDLSKRTALYADASRFVNTGFLSAGTGRFDGSASGLTTTSQHGLNEFAIGVRHSF